MMREKIVAISFIFRFCLFSDRGVFRSFGCIFFSAAIRLLRISSLMLLNTLTRIIISSRLSVNVNLSGSAKSPKIAHVVNNAPQNQSALRCIRIVFAASRRRYSSSHLFSRGVIFVIYRGFCCGESGSEIAPRPLVRQNTPVIDNAEKDADEGEGDPQRSQPVRPGDDIGTE